MEIAELLESCFANKCNVDIISGFDDKDMFRIGVRLRPWTQTSIPEMIIATGKTLDLALAEAVKFAEAARWENLDWSKRPWTQEKRSNGKSWTMAH